MTVLVRLPWPPSKTSKNGSQGDYRGKAQAAKTYKGKCLLACIEQGVRKHTAEGNVPVYVTYYPPSGHRVDWDNLAGRCKTGFDAVAEKTGIDDGRWWPVVSDKGEKVPGGAVLVELRGVTS